MTGLRKSIAIRTVSTLLDTLGDDDFFNVLTASNFCAKFNFRREVPKSSTVRSEWTFHSYPGTSSDFGCCEENRNQGRQKFARTIKDPPDKYCLKQFGPGSPTWCPRTHGCPHGPRGSPASLF